VIEDDDTPEIGRWIAFELRKAAWIRANPGAYPSEYEHAMRVIRDELGL
jgi:hypothetical protein